MWVIFAYTLSEVYYSAQCFEKWRIGCYRFDKTYLFFVICYLGVVISGNAQDVTLCPLIMISINLFFLWYNGATRPTPPHCLGFEFTHSHIMFSRITLEDGRGIGLLQRPVPISIHRLLLFIRIIDINYIECRNDNQYENVPQTVANNQPNCCQVCELLKCSTITDLG